MSACSLLFKFYRGCTMEVRISYFFSIFEQKFEVFLPRACQHTPMSRRARSEDSHLRFACGAQLSVLRRRTRIKTRHHTCFCVQNGSFEPQNAVSNDNRNTTITLAKRKIQAGACSGLWRCSDRGPPDCCFCYRPLTASRFENQQQADLEIRSCTLTLLCY